MKFDQDNVIVSNIFNEEQIKKIYAHVNSTSKEKVGILDFYGQAAYHSWLPDEIVDVIVEKAQSITDTPLELRELSFARYSLDTGHKPQLNPHVDHTFKEPRLTFDIQLRSTIPWAIVVEGRSYTLKDNEALTFAGTHQVHWRDKVDFTKDDFTDMIFCHFSEKGVGREILDQDFTDMMTERERSWQEIYDQKG
jgi:hypothetical protein